MPTYEYRCGRCGAEFEKVQRITSTPGARCPACGSKSERLLSAGGGLVFKGSGFYLTDYGRAGQKAKAEAGEPGGDKPAAGKPGSDKPAAKQPEKSPTPAKPKQQDH